MAYGFAPAWRGAQLRIIVVAALSLAAISAYAETPRPTLVSVIGVERPLVLDALGGGRRSVAESRGRIVLVHFFATWCEPCRPELASLARLREEVGGRGLDILLVSVAEPDMRLARFFAEHPVRMPVLLDRDRAVSRTWGIDALPSTVVLDGGGRPRLAVRGDLDWQRADVRAALDTLLAEKAGT